MSEHSILDIIDWGVPFAVVGHRGAKGECAENTLSCIEYALKKGVDIVEVDVRATKDGELIVLHDETFKRVAGLDISPRDLTLKEIKENIQIFGKYRVPTLKEILRKIDNRAGIFVEIKEPDTVQKVVQTVLEEGIPNLTAFISFHKSALKGVKEINKGLITGLIYSKPESAITEAKKIGAKIVLPRWPLATTKAVAFAHRLKLKVVPWVINTEEELQRVLKARPDAIATDRPSWLLKRREELRGKD